MVKGERKMRKSRMDIFDKVFAFVVYLVLAIIFIITLYPLIYVLSASFSDPNLVSAGKLVLFPVGFNLNAYQYLADFKEIWIGYGNTIFYTFVGTLFNLIITMSAAYGLARRDLPYRGLIMGIFVVTMYFSGGLIPGYLNIKSLGLLNTRTIMLIGGLVSVYNLIVARTFFANSIPWELHEACFLDGASDIQIFTNVALPLSKPIMAVLLLYYAEGHWNSYFSAMIYLSDRIKYPLQLFLREILLQSQIAASSLTSVENPETIAALMKEAQTANQIKYAIVVIATIPMLLVYPKLEKYFAKGVMIGSIKG